MSKKKITLDNYLEYVPIKNPDINWKNEDGKVTLEMENKGAVNRIFQKLFKKPGISYIHLDETGSFVWPLIDGQKSILDISKYVDEQFGEKAHPLYERLAQFFQILRNYNFITYKG